jgi:ribosome-binding protein aMBF1 (putative translation factor)
MSHGLLNTELVQRMRESRGMSHKWLVQHVGLKTTAGYYLLKEGLLPKDPTLRKSVLKKLSALFGVDEDELVLRLQAKVG